MPETTDLEEMEVSKEFNQPYVQVNTKGTLPLLIEKKLDSFALNRHNNTR